MNQTLLKWTEDTENCYKLNGNCDSCPVNEMLSGSKCEMQKTVKKLIANIGTPENPKAPTNLVKILDKPVMPREQRELFSLLNENQAMIASYILDGLNIKEIALKTGKNETTISQAVTRIFDKYLTIINYSAYDHRKDAFVDYFKQKSGKKDLKVQASESSSIDAFSKLKEKAASMIEDSNQNIINIKIKIAELFLSGDSFYPEDLQKEKSDFESQKARIEAVKELMGEVG